MFFSSRKDLKVELLTPKLTVQLEQSRDNKHTKSQELGAAGIEVYLSAFKILGFISLSLHGALAIYGYSALTGYYDKFSIGMSELEISLPMQLLYGYVYIFNAAISTANKAPLVGVAILVAIFLVISSLLVWMLNKKSSTDAKLGLSGWLAVLLLLAFFFPIFGVVNGQDQAVSDIKNNTGVTIPDVTAPISTIISADKEKISGYNIIATSKYTFLIRGNVVYKFETASGKILRETQLRDRSSVPSASTE